MRLLVIFLQIVLAAQNSGPPRLPVPNDAAVELAQSKIRTVLATEYKEAKSIEGKVRLAEKMIVRSNDPKESPVNQFAFFIEGRELYIDVGDLLSAFRTIDSISQKFDLDPLQQKLDMVQRISKVAKNSMQHRALAIVSLKLAGDAAAGEDYAVAKEFCQRAVSSARGASEPALLTRTVVQLRRYEVLFDNWQAASDARTILKNQPNDPDANSKVGRYKCFQRRDWENGLIALSHSSDPELASIAACDVKNPFIRKDQQALGKSWLKYAEKQEPSDVRTATAERAAFWLERATVSLGGLEKEIAEKQLNTAYEMACGRNFQKLVTRAANGLETGGVVDCRSAIHPLKLKPAFDLRKSWLLSLDFQPPNLDGGPHQIFIWGDGRAGLDPLFLRIEGNELVAACTDCLTNRHQFVATRVSASVVGQWVNVKFVHDTLAGEIELYVNHRLVGHEAMTMTPVPDQEMPLFLGGTNGGDQRFVGQVRNVWLGNIP